PHLRYEGGRFAVDQNLLAAFVAEQRSALRMFRYEGVFFVFVVLTGLYVLARSLAAARELERRQHNFLLAVTHEFKTPISTMRLLVETLQYRGQSRERLDDYLRRLERELTRLQHSSEQVLASARLEQIGQLGAVRGPRPARAGPRGQGARGVRGARRAHRGRASRRASGRARVVRGVRARAHEPARQRREVQPRHGEAGAGPARSPRRAGRAGGRGRGRRGAAGGGREGLRAVLPPGKRDDEEEPRRGIGALPGEEQRRAYGRARRVPAAAGRAGGHALHGDAAAGGGGAGGA